MARKKNGNWKMRDKLKEEEEKEGGRDPGREKEKEGYKWEKS